ncbi:MAG TPA: IS21 family transposase [Thermoanaerobaculia bacterium]|nr:IS21 family transposase [Thermoanaerobaculia bacterium]
MSNALDHEKQQQIVALGRLGWPLRRIEAATGIRRETVSGYLRAAGVAVRGRGGQPKEWPPKPAIALEVSTDLGSSKPAITATVSTDSGPRSPPGRAPSASACEPYRELIAEALARGRNAMAIWQDLVDDHGFTARYASVRRFVLTLRVGTPADARVVITTAPGEEGQTDYGEGPMVRDPNTGKYRRVRLFVFTLGYSRKSVRLLTWRSSAQIWAELHERAFRRVGGTVKVIVLDNLGEGVLTPDIYDPTLNPLYRDVLAHYGVVALPCRVGDPDRKGKVEAGVGHAQKTPLKGLRFETLEAAQAYLDRWEAHWADTRIHGTTKRQVAVMFAEERPALGPLPVEPFRYYRFGDRTVHLNGCVEVEGAYYFAPPGWLGQRVQVQWNDLHVRLLSPTTGQLLREHLRTRRGWYRIHDDDRPARTPPTTLALLARATSAGPHISAVCTQIHQHDGVPGVRRILGVLALAKKHGPAVVDDAAKAALEIGVPTYRFLRKYLERRPPVPLTLRQVDPLIRQLTLYRDLIDRTTGDPL